MYRLIFLLGCWLLSGCTTITVDGGKPTVKHYFGIANVNIVQDTSVPLIVSTKSIGLTKSPSSLSFGYLKESVSRFPDPSICSTLIIVETAEDLEAIKHIILIKSAEINTLCIASKEGKSWSSSSNTY